MRYRATLFLTIGLFLLNMALYAAAPLVDHEENVALFNQAAEQDRLSQKYEDDNESVPLAHDEQTEHHDNLSQKISELEKEIQELRGQIELQAHELQVMKKTSASTPTTLLKTEETAVQPDLKEPFQTKETTLKKTPATTLRHTNPADEQIAYLAAYERIKNKQFDAAKQAMELFIAEYPASNYTANAEYWLGELSLIKKEYQEAIQHFESVLKLFPTSNKAAPAFLKIGYALCDSGDQQRGSQHLTEVMRRFPDTTYAKLAQTKLKTLHAL